MDVRNEQDDGLDCLEHTRAQLIKKGDGRMRASLLARGIHFTLVFALGHPCVAQAPITGTSVNLLHALSALGVPAAGVKLL